MLVREDHLLYQSFFPKKIQGISARFIQSKIVRTKKKGSMNVTAYAKNPKLRPLFRNNGAHFIIHNSYLRHKELLNTTTPSYLYLLHIKIT